MGLKSIRNQRGQMAIFVALIFQVLFVLFAMAINVALVVHDKINLQNAVDLSAYYAAQRQAELLNAIAHQNYQIRQAWKLLAWRYRALGTMGLQRPPDTHPVWPRGNQGPLRTEAPFGPALDPGPAVCVTYKGVWKDVTTDENLCNRKNLVIPPLPSTPVIAGFNPFNLIISAISDRLVAQFNDACDVHGAINWWYAASILKAFREDQRNRKQVIFALADGLGADPSGDFVDIQGNSVLAGARKVFEKNLTFENEQGNPQMRLFNSFAGLKGKQWLTEMNVQPMVVYVDVAPGAACASVNRNVYDLPQRTSARTVAQQRFDPDGSLQAFAQDTVIRGGDFYNYAVGVEKNPWYVAYVGVQAETQPRQLFFPFGGGITLRARAFAKPFGGRIGPWFSARWPANSNYSVGEKVDGLLPPRRPPDSIAFDDPDDTTRYANYSRFPGDRLGLMSNLALAALNGQSNIKINYDDFRNIAATIMMGAPNDPLAFPLNGASPESYTYRNFELSAIAPDLFDITYYSIEPNYDEHYRKHIEANRERLGLPNDVPLRGDLGFRNGISAWQSYVVERQMRIARDYHAQEAFYFVRDKSHLLTDWAIGSLNLQEYEFPDVFGRCSFPDTDTELKSPGSCHSDGGRTGYSVKLVSRDFLLNRPVPYGGPGEPEGLLLNPPPTSEGW
jgi:hypothetical protein